MKIRLKTNCNMPPECAGRAVNVLNDSPVFWLGELYEIEYIAENIEELKTIIEYYNVKNNRI